MNDFLQRLKHRKIVQWAIAYVAGAWALLQILEFIADEFGWPGIALRIIAVVLAIGFFVTLVLAWYHGDRGAQRVGGIELVMLAALLVIAAVAVTWVRHRYGGITAQVASVPTPHAATGQPASTTTPSAARTAAQQPAMASPIAAQPIPAKSVAVLPFANMSADKNNAYFADGMQDLILTKLADIGDLKVISRTSTLKYASHPDDLKTIGRQLGVATILEGSVQKAGNQVLINVQLIDVKTDGHIWAESYTRTLDNIFGVEGEVAEKVAKALQAKLSPVQANAVNAVPTRDPVAYDLYLKAQQVANAAAGGDWADMPSAIAAYRKVVQQDPTFALAWANLAFMQAIQYWSGGADQSVSLIRDAEANVRKALALQPDLPQAHLVLGYVYRWGYNDYTKALAEYKVAAAGMPNSALVAESIGYVYLAQGYIRAEIAQLRQAITLDPRDPHLLCQLSIAYSATRDYASARKALEHALAISPADVEPYLYLSTLDVLQNGDAAAALKLLDGAPASIQANVLMVNARIDALLIQRDFNAARRYATQIKPGHGMSTLQVALIRANLLWLAGARTEAAPFYATVLARIQTQVATSPRPYQTYAELALAAARLGRAADAMAYGQKMAALSAQSKPIPYDLGIHPWLTLAKAYAASGDKDAAVSALEKTFARDSGWWISVPLLKIDPTWDPIRHDPRFQALLKKYGATAPVGGSTAAPAASAVPATDGARETRILPVIPAQAGIHFDLRPMKSRSNWTPAFAGVTEACVDQRFLGA